MKNKAIITLATLLLFAANPLQTALAEMETGRILNSTLHGAVDAAFTETERQLINQYFDGQRNTYHEGDDDRRKHKKKKKGKKQKGLPPGLAKKGQLPPGLQKQLDRNGTLPPGLAKRSLPSGLESRLPPAPNGMERIIADTHVLLVDKTTGVIRDIIRDIVK